MKTPGKWRKSTRSGANTGNCVETRAYNMPGSAVEIRDSKAPHLGSLALTRPDFTALLYSVK